MKKELTAVKNKIQKLKDKKALIDDETLVDIADQVKADDFYDRRHQAIFKAIMKLYQKNTRLDQAGAPY